MWTWAHKNIHAKTPLFDPSVSGQLFPPGNIWLYNLSACLSVWFGWLRWSRSQPGRREGRLLQLCMWGERRRSNNPSSSHIDHNSPCMVSPQHEGQEGGGKHRPSDISQPGPQSGWSTRPPDEGGGVSLDSHRAKGSLPSVCHIGKFLPPALLLRAVRSLARAAMKPVV